MLPGVRLIDLQGLMVLGDVHIELGMHGLAVEVDHTFPRVEKRSEINKVVTRGKGICANRQSEEVGGD